MLTLLGTLPGSLQPGRLEQVACPVAFACLKIMQLILVDTVRRFEAMLTLKGTELHEVRSSGRRELLRDLESNYWGFRGREQSRQKQSSEPTSLSDRIRCILPPDAVQKRSEGAQRFS